MKYSFEEKLAAVKYYLEHQSYKYPDDAKTGEAKRRYQNNVRAWIAKYRLYGDEGLRHKGMVIRSAEEKLDIIRPCMEHEIPIMEQQRRTGILGGTLIAWIKAYLRSGIQGLECKPGRKPKSMPEDRKKKETDGTSKTDREKDLERQLDDAKRQLLYLQFENDLLKKVKALEREERIRCSGPKRSGPSSKAKNTKGR